MMKVDLHCHSKFSAHPSEWFLQRIGARESYTEVESLYRQARARGMTHVTITDHNTIDGALELVRSHPDDTFISVEATAYFPEDGCKVHILIYDITPVQFNIIQDKRQDIYRLRDYLREENLACSVAHATYSVNNRLTGNTIEKLLLLFDVFEGINGARGKLHNGTVQKLLSSLDIAQLDRLRKKHGIEPWGDQSWRKGLTGGSDDHAGLFIGRTYTESISCVDVQGLVLAIKEKTTVASGSQGGHKSLAFAIYKIARDFSKDKAEAGSWSFMSFVSSLLFTEKRAGFRGWWALNKLKRAKDSRTKALARFCEEISSYHGDDPDDSHARIEAVYDSLGRLTDEFLNMVMTSLEKDLKNGQTDRVMKNISATLPAAFMIAPFFTSAHHLYCRNRDILRHIDDSFGVKRKGPSSILWFSDTVCELNGVAVTMRELATTASRTGHPVKVVTSLPESEASGALPENTINLPCIYSVTPEFYSAYTLRIPSVLGALDIIANESPDEIVISTPGPVGLLGMAAARVLGIKCTGVYHTDFTRQADHFIGDEKVSSMIEAYTRWFFQQMDHVRVPSRQYITMLSDRGLDPTRMSIFRRGMDPEFAGIDRERQAKLCRSFDIRGGDATLMWAGRLGKEKNLDFLMDVCREVMSQRPLTSLVIAGDGPERERMMKEAANDERIVFTGRLDRKDLAQLYLLSDIFVFPSTTDTFGMVIIEGHACGLPAIVSDVGGPQEIVKDGETGFVVKANDKQAWVSAIIGMLDLKQEDPEIFDAMRSNAREGSNAHLGWERLLDEMTGMPEKPVIYASDENSSCRTTRAAALQA